MVTKCKVYKYKNTTQIKGENKVLVVPSKPKKSRKIKGFDFLIYEDAGDLENRAYCVETLKVTMPVGVLHSIESIFKGYGMGSATTRALNAIRVESKRHYHADFAILRLYDACYEKANDSSQIAVIVEADIYINK